MDSFQQSGEPESVGPVPRPEDRHDDSGETAGANRLRVRCRGVDHAPRTLEVLLDRDRVVLAGPPGATAALPTDRVGQLSSALRFAADQARK
ncbi:hypothetical protein CDG81_00365 [Actinopolyspora erythraea]|uniref:DUF397 domain-containing protein n=1 Tax=Actinopolyspora erythraea TaxID=414996 RepID=A0A099DBC6_9ACTN|nr:hypothetical protein CDG81_00365 [Actinopolyspora erythraea]KGI83027.1 hypothetical protein IL38_01315 [Actinopolyspora erythraea]